MSIRDDRLESFHGSSQQKRQTPPSLSPASLADDYRQQITVNEIV
jgi:hypothetical protein